MTYDEWKASQAAPSSLPSPPTPPAAPPFDLGDVMHRGFRRVLGGPPELNLPPPYIDRIAKFLDPRSTTNPSFQPMPGERLALQMPGADARLSQLMAVRKRMMDLPDPQVRYPQWGSRNEFVSPPPPRNIPPSLAGQVFNRANLRKLKDWWDRTGYREPPPGLRDMPRANAPQSTPYPRAPFETRAQWLQVPLDGREIPNSELNDFSPGNYPSPANRQIPEAYDTLTSGGALA